MITSLNIIQYFIFLCILGSKLNPEGKFMIISELMTQGSLKNIYQKRSIEESEIIQYSFQIACGIIFERIELSFLRELN
jgi:serine/threonine protein kinase